MNEQIEKNISPQQSDSFEQRLNTIAWNIKCHWAKHFPIKIITTEDIEVAAINFENVYVHPKISQFDDDVLFCILAHEWAHRMVSPKSIGTGKRITQAVAESLNIDLPLAQLLSGPAIELIVDRVNCEVSQWSDTYQKGFNHCFTSFAHDLEKQVRKDREPNTDILSFQKMILALRIANVSTCPLPLFIRDMENKARQMISPLFENWHGSDDINDPDHIEKIIRFSKYFYAWIPKKLFKNKNLLQLLNLLLKELDDMINTITPISHGNGSKKGSASSLGCRKSNETQDSMFNIVLTRQITDHLMQVAKKPRQLTGLWQPGHSFSKLDFKRSFRCSSKFIPGLTTRRKIDSSRTVHFEAGKKFRLFLIIDDSGSMSGPEAHLSRSICEGVNRFSAQKDMHIGLITFGYEIDISFPPTRRHQKITKALARLDGNLGGTSLLPPLKRLSHYLESDRDITHAMLVTDAAFSDWDDCQHTINDILTRINITVLLINSDPPEDVLNTLKDHHHAISFFKIDPSEPPHIAILEEIIR